MVDRGTIETGAGGRVSGAAGSSSANRSPRSPDPGGQGAGEQDPFTADDLPDGLSGEDAIQRLLVRELGEELAGAFELARQAQERWARRRRPGRACASARSATRASRSPTSRPPCLWCAASTT